MKVRTRFGFDYLLYVALVVIAAMFSSDVSAWAQSNPVPLVNNPLVPASALPGGAGFTLTVNGTGFVQSSVVDWNASPLVTSFVSGSRLTATVPAANVGAAGTASVTVVNPTPGGGRSNVGFFDIRQPFTAVSFGRATVDTGGMSEGGIVTDLNKDGKLDLITIDPPSGMISSLLGNGDGTFQLANLYSAGGFPTAIAAGDFNGDGNPDLAVPGIGLVATLLGDGDGTFQPEQDISVPGLVGLSITTGDFNGDGKLDIAVGNGGATNIFVLLGNGDGTFQNAVSYTAGNGVEYGLAAGDFNGDGRLDLVVDAFVDGAVAVLLGNGDGTFQNSVEYLTAPQPESLLVADLNMDGILDIAAACNGDAFSVLLGNSDGTFQSHRDHSISGQGIGIVSSDLNGDGALDLVVSYFNSRATSTFLGNGDGTFQHQNDFILVGNAIVTGDFNGDGRADLASANGVDVALSEQAVLSSTVVRFGSVQVGSSKTVTITLSNIGSSAFRVNRISVNGNQAPEFSQISNCMGKSLAGGSKCAIRVTFAPQMASFDNTAMLKISDGGAHPLQTVFLEGLSK